MADYAAKELPRKGFPSALFTTLTKLGIAIRRFWSSPPYPFSHIFYYSTTKYLMLATMPYVKSVVFVVFLQEE